MIHSIRWTLPKIERRLLLIEPLVYRRRVALAPFHYRMLDGDDALQALGREADTSDWDVLQPLSHWGQAARNYVLRGSFQIPGDWEPNAPCALYLPLGEAGDFSHPEGLIYVDGQAYAASDRHHQEVRLRDEWKDGEEHVLALTVWTGMGGGDLLGLMARTVHPSREFSTMAPASHLMRECQVVQIDQPTRDFVAAARVAVRAARAMDENVPARGKILYALDAAFKLLETREPFGEEFYASVGPAHAALREGIAQAGAPLDVAVSATGHAHIDVAWLWTLGQTRQKAARTFHTVLSLMEQFPEYHFTQSQPQLYDYVRQDHPELFQAIKRRVAEGRWETIGGMWVEADCNLSGAESLARQFLLGRAFFAEHFGTNVDSPVLWLPDVFGYAWALPQLIKQAGLEYFFTIKIGWNQYNRLPYDSFWWQGIDGTRVLTHFSTTPEGNGPASTYNAMATPEQLLGTWTNFLQKDLGRGEETPPLLMAYGFGDGGGGPTREMLENIREMGNFPALPRIQQESVSHFFHALEESFGDALPTWNAELYFELHRGTYTTQSRNKRANRSSEFRLHDAEYLAMQAALLDPAFRYPHESFRQAWELVCLNQFHDIIPGSSINQVYEESQQQYRQIAQLAREAQTEALESLARRSGGHLLVVNPTSFARADLALWPEQLPEGYQLVDARTGEPVSVQSAGERGTWLALTDLAPFSLTPLQAVPGEAAPFIAELTATPELLENSFVRVEFNTDGDITRVFDKKAGREVLAPGALANQFQAFEDRPKYWDAWDIDVFYDDKMWTAEPASAVRVLEAGPLRATLEIERQILHSRYTQRISLAYNSPRLDFETDIDWRERHILLKVAFPVDILSPVATYEIQWGNVQRPTHRNTSWDWARFETCAQKWVDLGEGDYGISVLNDCKYGHDIRDNVIRISLLRSPTSPDPLADQGQHTFTYSLLPHTGTWDERTIGSAYMLNDPLIVHTAASLDEQREGEQEPLASLVAAGQPNIVIETVKQAEDGQGLIVRFYESQRRRGLITLTTSFPLQAAWRTNLLEQNESELAATDRQITLPVRPYEIVTLRLVPATA
ncbi:MAG TPA: alpha-mannosidase [Ktedonobacteraceae bacterium]|nr:alpha-mannosidase [Ktedonobacteraceae bacterium]